jgi:hypothetical protein
MYWDAGGFHLFQGWTDVEKSGGLWCWRCYFRFFYYTVIYYSENYTTSNVVIGGVMISVLAIGPKGSEFKPGRE